MTYTADETAHKQPLELYQFTIQGVFYRYTSSELQVVHPVTGSAYTPEPVIRGELQQSEEDASMSLDISVDALNPVAAFFRTPFLNARTVFVLVERTHPGAVDAPAVLFRGQVAQAVFSGAMAKMTCVPIRQAIARAVPSVLVQVLCSNTLYDARCLVNPATVQVAGLVISTVIGVILVIPGHGKPDGYFSGGTVTVVGLPSATIRDQTGDAFTLLYNYGFTPGSVVTLYPGCDKKLSTCVTKFANSTHYQGFPDMPVIDPFVDSIT